MSRDYNRHTRETCSSGDEVRGAGAEVPGALGGWARAGRAARAAQRADAVAARHGARAQAVGTDDVRRRGRAAIARRLGGWRSVTQRRAGARAGRAATCAHDGAGAAARAAGAGGRAPGRALPLSRRPAPRAARASRAPRAPRASHVGRPPDPLLAARRPPLPPRPFPYTLLAGIYNILMITNVKLIITFYYLCDVKITFYLYRTECFVF